MLKMSTIGRNARVQTFAKVVDSFVSFSVASNYKINTFIMSTNMLDITWRQQWRHLLS